MLAVPVKASDKTSPPHLSKIKKEKEEKKMTDKKILQDNVFNLEKPRKKILAFITQGGHISGRLMKGIEYRMPKKIEELKLQLEGKQIGDVIEIDYINFVVIRKHYNSKLTEKSFEENLKKALPKLNGAELKTTDEDWPQFKHIVQNLLPGIEYRFSSEWPHK